MDPSKTILLVEDEPLIAMSESMVIKDFGYNVIISSTGEDAVRQTIDNENINLILMDIDLGNGIDGTAAAKLILEKRNIPIVFLTSHFEKEMVDKVKGITRYGYVIKNSGEFVIRTSIEMAFEMFEAYRKITESEIFNRRIVETANEGIISLDENNVIVSGNRKLAEMLGYTLDELIGMSALKLSSPEEALKHRQVMSDRRMDKKGFYERRLLRKDGSEIVVVISSAPIFKPGGSFGGSFGMITDITQRYRSDLLLKESEEKYRAAFITSPDAININSMDGTYIDINEGFTKLTGYLRQDVIGLKSTELLIWAEPEDRLKLIAGLREKGLVDNLEAVFRSKDGTLKTALMSARIIMINNVPHILSITRDITERKNSEEKIKALLKEKELLIKEMNHRIKNNLNTILALLSLQSSKLKNTEAVNALMETKTRVHSMMILYDKIYISKNYSRISIRDYASQLVDEITCLFPGAGKVKIEKYIEDFDIDTKTLFNVGIIINEIITNSMKYAFTGREDGRLYISISQKDGKVIIEIGDNGPGIPESIDIDSSGFGLQLVKLLTGQIGGILKIERRQGCKFTVEFKLE